MSSAGNLSDLHGAAGDPADALWLPAGLRPGEQGPYRLSVPSQLVCADSQGMETNKVFTIAHLVTACTGFQYSNTVFEFPELTVDCFLSYSPPTQYSSA